MTQEHPLPKSFGSSVQLNGFSSSYYIPVIALSKCFLYCVL
ncbi:MAG: hypothetical protein PUP92_24960 [Rhizonema sp. PD38]|nr:hypothetical protein [Rhizonema sp. PD38]